ncbi:MAG: NACHT domain-containing protein [Tannerellaceae bacterium]
MGIIETLGLPLLLSVVANKISDRIAPDIQNKIVKAYEIALNKWSENEYIVKTRSCLVSSDFRKVINDLILKPEELNDEDQLLLKLFKEELNVDSDIVQYLSSIQVNEILKDIKTVLSRLDEQGNNINKLVDDVGQIKNAVCDKNQKEALPFDYFVKNITLRKYYIPRKIKKCREIETDTEYRDSEKTILGLIEEKKDTRIVLLGGAGLGKTTEFQQVALELTKRNKYPILVSLNNYTSTDKGIEKYFNAQWGDVSPEQLVVLLDGFDEIEPNSTMQAIRDIQSFAERNPLTRIVVSSRTNFYNASKEDRGGSTLHNFGAYMLKPLTIEDYKLYIAKNYAFEYEAFYNELSRNMMLPIIENPFFLIALAEIYDANKKLEKNRGLIINELIDKRVKNDIVHYKDTFEDIENIKDFILQKTREIAMTMVISGRRSISGKELLFLCEEEQNVSLIKNTISFLIPDEKDHWRFEHSYFLEYLAAEYLIDLNLDGIKQLMLGSGSGRIMPIWQNTLTLLLSILRSGDELFDPLVDWLAQTDPVALIGIEPERLTDQLREDIFYTIFNYYKAKQIWIDNARMNYGDYALFGNLPSCIDFIVDEATNSANDQVVRMNALYVLREMDFSTYINSGKVIKELVSLVEEENATPNFIMSVVDTISIVNIRIRSCYLDTIFNVLKHRKNEYIRASMYNLLLQKGQVEEYIAYIMFGVILLKNKSRNSSDRSGITFVSERLYLESAILQCKSGKAICEILEWLVQNKNLLHECYINGWFDGMIDNAIIAYPKCKSVFESVSVLLLSISITESKLSNKLLSFFHITETIELLIDKLLDVGNLDYRRMSILAAVVSLKTYPIIIDAYENNKMSAEELKSVCLSISDKEQRLQFCKEIEKHTGQKIILPTEFDWEKYDQEQNQSGFDILFDLDRFKNECEMFISMHTPLTHDKYKSIRSEMVGYDTTKELCNRSVSDFIYELLDSDEELELTPESIGHYINEWDLIIRIHELLKNDSNQTIEVTADQCNYIQRWFDKHINAIDFTNTVKKGEGAGFSINNYAFFLFYFKTRFNFRCEEKVLLDMTLCAGNLKGILPSLDCLYTQCDKREFEEYIIENILDARIKSDLVYKEHVEFIFKHKLSEAYSDILDRLKDATCDIDLKTNIIRLYFQEGLPVRDIKKIWSEFDIILKLEVAEELCKSEDYAFIKGEITPLYSSANKEQQKRINELLIKSGDILGLENSIAWITKYKENPFGYRSYSWLKYSDIRVLPYLVQMLECYYGKIIGGEHSNRQIYQFAIDGLKSLSLANEDNCTNVITALEEFIVKNDGRFDHVHFLNREIEIIKKDYDKTFNPIQSLEEAKKMLKELKQS